MFYTGFTDEAAKDLDSQLKALELLGWHHMEARNLFDGNLASISEEEFEELQRKLQEKNVTINCFGSTIGNSGKSILESPQTSYDELKNAIPRMQKLGIKMVRMMSFGIPGEEREEAMKKYFDEVVKRVSVLAKMAEEAGIICAHENCVNFGGLSADHTLRLVEKVNSPALKLIMDTGNPVFSDDMSKPAPRPKQSAWEFYNKVKDFVVYIHIKDAVMDGEKILYTFPFEGHGDVEKIVKDMLKNGYDGGFSMEPHLFHGLDKSIPEEERQKMAFDLFVEYGRKFEAKVNSWL